MKSDIPMMLVMMVAIGAVTAAVVTRCDNRERQRKPIVWDLAHSNGSVVYSSAPTTGRVESVNYVTNYFYVEFYWLNQNWGLSFINGSKGRPWAVCRDVNGRLEQFPISYPEPYTE